MFAFMSRVSLKVQRSLTKAENALQIQSEGHPHGWGVAYYLTGAREPHVVASVESAFTDERFGRLSEFLTSHAVVAHVRKATVGDLGLENTHPFRFGRWTFCHNGTIFGFEQLRDDLRARIDPRFWPAIAGQTDSETLFYAVLTTLQELGVDVDAPGDELPEGTGEAIGELVRWLRDRSAATGADAREAMVNFVLTDGNVLVASRFNGRLHFSTQKRRCADFDICPVADKVCFGPRRDVRHTHVLIASDPTSSDDVWEEIPHGGLITVDSELRLAVHEFAGFDGPPPWIA
jgi:glutamine amidotransferase